MRKGFDGLSGIVLSKMQRNPNDGSVYIFINRRRNRMKLLVWHPYGFVMYYKRLERGTFELPQLEEDDESTLITWETLMLLLSGISLKSVKLRKRFTGFAKNQKNS